MPIPSFTETLGSPLGPDITIIEGDFFSDSDADKGLNIETMNDEMNSLLKKDGIIFMQSVAQAEDIPFQRFLESRGKNHIA
jgi:hypothetical protein